MGKRINKDERHEKKRIPKKGDDAELVIKLKNKNW